MVEVRAKSLFRDTDGTEISTLSSKRDLLYKKFQHKIAVNTALDRTLVSFQASKDTPFSGWFKYREGFSESLITYLLQYLGREPGCLLDPFSGAGAALFAGRKAGWRATGIEVLPVGVYASRARLAVQETSSQKLRNAITEIERLNFLNFYDVSYELKHIAITRGAFPPEEQKQLVGYIAYCHCCIADEQLRTALLYAAFCILETISYTRKDGQYLRWDVRSGRSQGKKIFHKGYIPGFREAIIDKLNQIAFDLDIHPTQASLFELAAPVPKGKQELEIHEGSCLDILPTMATNSIDVVLTSPPYANRYDYTRTYALELVYLGCSEEKVKQLRQEMLSCTVENKDKTKKMRMFYMTLGRITDYRKIDQTFNSQEALQEVLALLEAYRAQGKLNNTNIARMIRNYFYEMCFAIFEFARVLKPGGAVIMVNDNVRYAGEEIPVDLILSDFAESFGLSVKHIWTLERGKGNSSQQMGNHGRSELRKCVYIWEKAN